MLPSGHNGGESKFIYAAQNFQKNDIWHNCITLCLSKQSPVFFDNDEDKKITQQNWVGYTFYVNMYVSVTKLGPHEMTGDIDSLKRQNIQCLSYTLLIFAAKI